MATTATTATTSTQFLAANGEAPRDNPERAVPAQERITSRYMSKYERTRIVGTRALQLSQNAPVLVNLNGETDPLKIAKRELQEKKIPIIVRRHLPNGRFEDWSVHELIVWNK